MHTHSHFSTAVSCLIHLLLSMGEIHFAPVLLLSEVLSVTCDDGWRCENTIAFWLAIRESSYFMCNIVHTTLHFSKNVKSSAMINVKSKGLLHCLPRRIFYLAFDTKTAYLIFQKLPFFADFRAQCNTYIVWGLMLSCCVCTLLYLFETLHNWMRSRISHSAMEAKLKQQKPA